MIYFSFSCLLAVSHDFGCRVFQYYRSNFEQIQTKPDPVTQKLIQVETASKKGETLKEISYRVEQVGRHTTDEEVENK